MANTATGSVAEIRLPKSHDSFIVNAYEKPDYPMQKNIKLLKVMAINVPIKENIITVPIFLKNGVFYILYPDSNIIGGSKTIMNKLTK